MFGINSRNVVVILLTVLLCAGAALAQSSGFTYQGRITDGGLPADGNYDLQFALFDSAGGNNQIGQTQTIPNVTVSEGVFTVTLDFGANAFPGASRWLEISARPVGAASFTVLIPRQQITSTPYAMRSLSTAQADTATNTQQLGGVAASAFVKTDDARLSDPRDPKTGSSSYIQNSTSAQTNTNFNISGNGTAGGTLSGNVVNATTRYDIGGQRVLSAQASNQNTFLGLGSGASNTTGERNSFFGYNAGRVGTTASFNSIFGNLAGQSNTTGSGNSFFGVETGKANTTGSHNVIVGDQAGYSNTTGNSNVIIGDAAGFFNTTESDNTFVGGGADGAPGITNATAIGANSSVTASNALVLGNNVNVGIGTSDPFYRLHVINPGNLGLRVETGTRHGWVASFGGNGDFLIDEPGNSGGRFIVQEDGKVGIGKRFPDYKLEVVNTGNVGLRVQTNSAGGKVASFGGSGDFEIDRPGVPGGRFSVKENGFVGIGTDEPGAKLDVSGNIRFLLAFGAGSTQLCQSANGFIAACSSSLRYKTDLRPFLGGLNVVNRLRPITFKWKSDQSLDLGFGAEDVAAVEPLLVTHNAKGEVEGVKYDRLSAVFINAFKEQQAQIEQQQTEAKQLKSEARQLKAEAEEQKAVVQQQQDQIAALRESNQALNERLRLIERSLKRRASRSRR